VWTGKNDETRLGAFEMKGLRKTLWVSWTAKKTNEWVLNEAGVKRELFHKNTYNGPVYHALSIHLSQGKLITRFADRYTVAKFSKSRDCSKVPEGSTIIIKVPEFPYNTM